MEPAPVSDLETHLGYWLRFVSNHVSQAFARKVEAMDVTVAEWVLLRELYARGSMPPSQLAGHLDLTRGAITKLADRLIAKQLVVRRADDEDGRAQILSLTKKGRALVPELAALADRNDEEYFGHLSAGEKRQLDMLLRGIVERSGLKTRPIS